MNYLDLQQKIYSRFDTLCHMARGIFERSFNIITIILIMIAVTDIKQRRIPNRLTVILGICALLSGFLWTNITWTERIVGSLLVSGMLLFMILLRPGSFGMGDVKLMAAAGLLLGWKNTLVAFAIAVVVAGIYSITIIWKNKEKIHSSIAFGPFLCIGIETALVFGNQIIWWYIN